MHHLSTLFISSFLSLLPLDSFVYSWQKGGEDFMARVHILRGRNYTSCTFIGGEIHRGDAYIKREKKFFYEKTLFYLMLLFSVLYGALCSMLYCSYRIMFMCWTCIHPHACLDDHLLCYVVIVVISIWLFWCMIKLLICFTSCLLDRNLLGTLYFSFLLLALPWGSNVFCASVSGYWYIYSKFITAPKIHDKGSDTESSNSVKYTMNI